MATQEISTAPVVFGGNFKIYGGGASPSNLQELTTKPMQYSTVLPVPTLVNAQSASFVCGACTHATSMSGSMTTPNAEDNALAVGNDIGTG